MKFRYYITNLHEGCVQGANNPDVANDFASSEDYFVVDSEAGKWIAIGSEVEIEDAE